MKTPIALTFVAALAASAILVPTLTNQSAAQAVTGEKAAKAQLMSMELSPILKAIEMGQYQEAVKLGLAYFEKQGDHNARKSDAIVMHYLYGALEGDVMPEGTYAKIIATAKRLNNDALSALALKLVQKRGELEDVEHFQEKLGYVSGWCVVGPFDNERGAGFSREFGPEQSLIDFETSFEGKAGRNVQWRPLPVDTIGGELDFDAIMNPNDEVLAYAATTVQSEKAGKATLHLSSDEGFRVWVNGQEVANTPNKRGQAPQHGQHVHRPSRFDQNILHTTLQAGSNLIVVKVTEAEDQWGMSLRVKADHKISTASAAEVSTWQNRMPGPEMFAFGQAEPSGVIDPLPTSLQDRFTDALFEHATKRSERKDRVAMKALNAIKDEFYTQLSPSDQASLLFHLSLASQSTAATSAGVDENAKRDMLLEILKINPHHYGALVAMAKHYVSTLENTALARQYISKAKAVSDTFEIRFAEARNVLDRNMVDTYFAKLKKLIPEQGELYTTTIFEHMAWFAERQGRKDDAYNTYIKWIEADQTSYSARSRFIEATREAGEEGVFDLLVQEGIDRHPLNSTWHEIKADHLSAKLGEKGKTFEREALQALQDALAIAPGNDELLSKAAKLSKQVADSALRAQQFHGVEQIDGTPVAEVASAHERLARNYYDQALAINPARSDIKRYLDYLDDKTPVWEEKLQENIDGFLAEYLKSEIDNSLPISVAYSDTINEVNSDGTFAQYSHIAWRVTNDQARMMLRRFPVPARGNAKVVSAKLWRADGTVEDSRIEGRTVINNNLGLGDVLEIRFRGYQDETSFFGDFYGDIQPFSAPVGAPVGRMKRTWVLPKDKEYNFYARGEGLTKSEKVVDDKRIVTYESKDLPKVEQEQLSLPEEQRAPTVFVSSFKDWKSWGAWYWNLIERQVRSTPAIVEKVAELTANAKTDVEKVRAIYNFTVQNIRYNAEWEFGVHGYKPYEAGTIFERCIGDCKDKAILIVTMLREAGITAYPVIINLETLRGIEDITCPGPFHFNHAIAYVEYKDGTGIFLDGTTTFNSYDEPSVGDAGAEVVVIKPEGGVRMKVPEYTPEEHFNAYTSTMTLDAQGNASFEVKSLPKGQPAASLRAGFVNEGRRKANLESMFGRYMTGVSVGEIKAPKLDDLDISPYLEFSMEADGYGESKAGGLEIRAHVENMDWSQTVLAYADERKNDMILPPIPGEKHQTTVKVPEGMSIDQLPEAVKIESKHFNYSLSFEKKDGAVVITRWLGFMGPVVRVADYPEFRANLIKAAAADKTTLRFQ